MIRHLLIASLLSALLFGCRSSGKEIDWVLEDTETIKYSERRGKQIQIKYSESNSGLIPVTDTSMVVETYRDTLLMESITYDIKNGKKIKWRHTINKFNQDGTTRMETDSVNGSLRRQSRVFYENGRVQRLEELTIDREYNDALQMVGADTTRSTYIYIYDQLGNCIKTMCVTKDELSSALTGTNRYDTSITYKHFNEQFLETKSITARHGDTTAIRKSDYDEHGREIRMFAWSDEFGLAMFEYRYDEHGNPDSVIYMFNEIAELTLTEYDSLDRPVTKKRFKRY